MAPPPTVGPVPGWLGAWAAAPVEAPLPDVPAVFADFAAPQPWQSIDLISDLHLTRASFDATSAVLERHLQDNPADALFILGDLFEAWIGDDATAVDPFAQRCEAWLQTLGARTPLFFMHGNRDFLVGRGLLDRCQATLLDDPTVLDFDDRRWLLTHGDALCIADHAYMAFRTQVRQPGFKQGFLSMPIPQRIDIARKMRERSEAHQDGQQEVADVDAALAQRWLEAADVRVMIHGHTHKPDRHLLPSHAQPPRERWVMSDWDQTSNPPRRQVLRLIRGGTAPQRIDLSGN